MSSEHTQTYIGQVCGHRGEQQQQKKEQNLLPYGHVSGQTVLSYTALPGYALENSMFHLLAISLLEFRVSGLPMVLLLLLLFLYPMLLAKDNTFGQHSLHSFIHSLAHQPQLSVGNLQFRPGPYHCSFW